jgi:hypothetical protein
MSNKYELGPDFDLHIKPETETEKILNTIDIRLDRLSDLNRESSKRALDYLSLIMLLLIIADIILGLMLWRHW